MAPGRLRQRPYQVHPNAFEGHLNDGQWNQWAGGRLPRRRPLAGGAGLTKPFDLGFHPWPLETVTDSLGGVFSPKVARQGVQVGQLQHSFRLRPGHHQ